MPTAKSKKDISYHIFQKYCNIRKEHDKDSKLIQEDIELIKCKDYIHLTLLVKCDLHHNMLFKILNSFRSNPKYCFTEITRNPFEFVMIPENVFSYEKAESICEKFELNINNITKCKAWIFDFILFKNNQIFIDKKFLHKHFYKTFDVSYSEILNELLIYHPEDNSLCTIELIYDIEKNMTLIMKKLYLKNNLKPPVNNNIINYITKHEKNNNIKFTTKQSKAIRNAIDHDFSIICGFPGTGKSTIADCICSYYTDKIICLAAPTGIASNNIKIKCSSIIPDKLISGTLHKLLFDTFIDLKEFPNIMIIDEFSMVDSVLFYRVLQWCDIFKCKLILLADNRQLPPIAAGYPLYDLLNSKLCVTTFLTKIKRQNQGNLKNVILKLSSDELYPIDSSDIDKKTVFFYNYSKKNIKNLIEKFDLNASNCQFISPQHKHEEGTISINNYLQSLYKNNTNQKIFPLYQGSNYSSVFQNNDLVVRNVNNYTDTDMYANGDIGTLKKTLNNCLEVHYIHDNRIQQILPNELYEEFSLSYCMTVHKVQGSQFDNIVLIINDNHHYSWMCHNAKNLLYTAISRAKEKCFIIGNSKLLSAAQRTVFKKKISIFMKQLV